MNDNLNTESCLSKREKEVAHLIAWGFTNKEIANKLFVSPLTISTHLKNIYQKLSIHKETDLCRWQIFYEYAIADNPLKKIFAVFLLILSLSMILTENPMVRTFNARPLKPVMRTVRAARTRRYENVFDLQLSLA